MERFRVLVIEDNSEIRSTLRQVLSNLGYEVLTFPEPGFCPLHVAGKCPCPPQHTCADVIISDIDMPHISGFEFVAGQIRKGCKVKNIALMSGGWSMDELKQAAELDCKAFFKPFDSEELNKWLVECKKMVDPDRKLYNWMREGKEAHN
jgi:CheY-like chemotaxis protein